MPTPIWEQYELGLDAAPDNPAARESLLATVQASGGMLDATDVTHQFGFADKYAGQLSIPFIWTWHLYPGCQPGAGQGRGDCKKANALVRMADGSERPIVEVSVGDFVLSHKGIPRKVTRFIEKDYSGDLVEVSFAGSTRKLTATPDHLIYTGEIESDFTEEKWKPIGKLTEGDWALQTRCEPQAQTIEFDLADLPNVISDNEAGNKRRNKKVRWVKPEPGYVRGKNSRNQCKRHIVLDEKLAWLLGFYLAEGSCDIGPNGPKRITFNIGKPSAVLAEQVVQYVKDVFDADVVVAQVPSKPTVIYARVGSQPIASLFKMLSGGGNTYTKSVPWQIFSCSRATRLAILRGWLDGDGHISRKRQHSVAVSGTSVSKSLLRGMFDIANSLGFSASTRTVAAYKHSKEAETLRLTPASAVEVYPEIKSEVRFKSETARVKPYGCVVKAKSIRRYAYTGKVYCLDVEVDHSFVADSYAVHNCVSHDIKQMLLNTMCCEIVAGLPDPISGAMEAAPPISPQGCEQGVLSTEANYWFAGNDNRKNRSGNYVEDGWYLAAAIEVAMKRAGAVLRAPLEGTDLDFTRYDPDLAGKYADGVPANVAELIHTHPVRTATEINGREASRDMVGAGFGVGSDGGQSFASKRDANGVASRTAKGWSHSMHEAGFDDRPTIVEMYGGPLVLLAQTWGKRWNSGPRDIFESASLVPAEFREFWIQVGLVNPKTGNIMIPEGWMWVRWRDVEKRRRFVVSGLRGWERPLLENLFEGF